MHPLISCYAPSVDSYALIHAHLAIYVLYLAIHINTSSKTANIATLPSHSLSYSSSNSLPFPCTPPRHSPCHSLLHFHYRVLLVTTETNEVLLRTFSIISAILVGRSVVGGGLFMDPTTCRPRVMGEPRSGNNDEDNSPGTHQHTLE